MSSSMFIKYMEEAIVATVTMIDFVGTEDSPAGCTQSYIRKTITFKLKVAQRRNVLQCKDLKCRILFSYYFF